MPEGTALEMFRSDIERLAKLVPNLGNTALADGTGQSVEAEFLRARLREAAASFTKSRPHLLAALDRLSQRREGVRTPDTSEPAADPVGSELRFFELLAEDVESRASQSEVSEARAHSTRQEEVRTAVRQELQSTLLRQPAVKLCLAALVVAVGFAVYGAIRFGDMEFNITREITAKRDQLVKELDAQREATARLTKELNTSVAAAQEGRREVDARITEARVRVGQLETDADRVIANFARDINRRYGAKFDDALNKLDQDIRASTEAAQKVFQSQTEAGGKKIADAATERANAMSAQAPNPVFSERLKALAADSTKLSQAVATSQGQLNQLSSKQALISKAMAAIVKPDQRMVDHLAGYVYEVLWVVYAGAGVILVLTLIAVGLLWHTIRLLRAAKRSW